MESWDVVIVGGGPLGSSTALHLAREGWAERILVLEKARYPRHKLCGGGITEYGVACLSRIGLDIDEISNVPIQEMRMVRGKRTASRRKLGIDDSDRVAGDGDPHAGRGRGVAGALREQGRGLRLLRFDRRPPALLLGVPVRGAWRAVHQPRGL